MYTYSSVLGFLYQGRRSLKSDGKEVKKDDSELSSLHDQTESGALK